MSRRLVAVQVHASPTAISGIVAGTCRMKVMPQAQEVLDRALAARVYSAVSAEIGDCSGPIWVYAQGRTAFDGETRVDTDTIFDLASLTKVVATTTIALLLTRQGVLDVDRRVSEVLPQWTAPDRTIVSARDLLEHSSGLPAYREYFRRLTGRDAYVDAIAVEPLEYAPRSQSIYSDLGFITLGVLLERLGTGTLDAQFSAWREAARIDAPLTYLPPADWAARTAMTEQDTWRGRWLQGEVHDENAAALGGVAAHAGLFGTAGAVGAAARWWLTELGHADAQRFAQRSAVAGSSRALGWDSMLPTSSCGTRMSTAAIGHTGFTGTSLWLDPARNRYFVLLTNRVHATRTSDAIQTVRREFHDAAHIDLS
jgi:CubicO group peptidase (beta-lactamase class C family)